MKISEIIVESTEQGVAEGKVEENMSRAAKGNEKYGKAGMKALAAAGRDGASDEKLDTIRDRYNKYDKKVDESSSMLEETYHDDDEFFEAYGVMEYSDDMINEAEYQGRKVALNKPMRGDVKKFRVFVKNEKGNVVKVNFGQKGARIKKNNPGRRKNFRARHNCDNPGPKTSARYWSCKKW